MTSLARFAVVLPDLTTGCMISFRFTAGYITQQKPLGIFGSFVRTLLPSTKLSGVRKVNNKAIIIVGGFLNMFVEFDA